MLSHKNNKQQSQAATVVHLARVRQGGDEQAGGRGAEGSQAPKVEGCRC